LARARLDSRVDQLETAVTAAKQSLDRIQTDTASSERALQQALGAVRAELSERVREQVLKMQEHSQDLNRASRDFATGQRRHEEEFARLQGLTHSMDAARKRHDTLHQLVAEHHEHSVRRHEEALQRVGQLSAALEEMQQRLGLQITQAANDMSQRLCAIDGRQEVHERCREQANTRLEELEGGLRHARHQLDELQVLHDGSNTFSEVLRKSMDTLRHEISVKLSNHTEEVSAACRELYKRQQKLDEKLGKLQGLGDRADSLQKRQAALDCLLSDVHRESTKREAEVNKLLNEMQQSLGLKVSQCMEEACRRCGLLDDQLELFRSRLDQMHTIAERLPEIAAQQATLKGQLEPMTAALQAQIDGHASVLKSQLDNHLSTQTSRVEQTLQSVQATFSQKAQTMERSTNLRLQELVKAMEQHVDTESKRARSLLADLHAEAHWSMSQARAAWTRQLEEFHADAASSTHAAGEAADALVAVSGALGEQLKKLEEAAPPQGASPRRHGFSHQLAGRPRRLRQ